MKKILLALIAFGFAFAISSCGDQSYCPKKDDVQEDAPPKSRCEECGRRGGEKRDDNSCSTRPERQHHRW